MEVIGLADAGACNLPIGVQGVYNKNFLHGLGSAVNTQFRLKGHADISTASICANSEHIGHGLLCLFDKVMTSCAVGVNVRAGGDPKRIKVENKLHNAVNIKRKPSAFSLQLKTIFCPFAKQKSKYPDACAPRYHHI
jgi:hypothetical protein